jgi:hypothetical protein
VIGVGLAIAAAFALGQSSSSNSHAASSSTIPNTTTTSSTTIEPTTTIQLTTVPTVTAPPSTNPPIVLTDPNELHSVLAQEAATLMGGGLTAADFTESVDEYHAYETQQQLAKDAGQTYYTADPAGQADAFIRTHHAAAIAAYQEARGLGILGNMLGPGGQTTTTCGPFGCP